MYDSNIWISAYATRSYSLLLQSPNIATGAVKSVGCTIVPHIAVLPSEEENIPEPFDIFFKLLILLGQLIPERYSDGQRDGRPN